ncbi:MAG: PorP/SprF family type IX secretion system membrane protein [Bacteroidota bacterium]
MKIKNIISLLGLFLITHFVLLTSSFAQDVHFTQSNMIPLMLNPALTGNEGDQRVFLNYKNQWRGMSANGSAFNTALFSFDAALMKKKWRRGYLGTGIIAYKDVAGDLKMGTTQICLSVAGIVHLSESQTLSGGLQGGFVQKSLSTANMQWESQYDASSGTYNSNLLSNDIATAPPTSYGDFSGGLAWNYSSPQSNLGANDQLKVNVGVAAQNVNTPKQTFSTIGNDQLYSKYILHSLAEIGIVNTDMAVMPSVVFYKQGASYELNVGTLFRWTIKEKSKYTGVYKGSAFSLGAQYRLNDAIAPVALFEYSHYSIGLSYDINISGLNAATQGKGGFEISLKYVNPNPFRSAPRLRDDN